MMPPTPHDKSFNWDKAKARLARTMAATTDIDNLTEEQGKAIMDERARKLAHSPPPQPDASEVLELVTFRIGSERFGIEAKFVHEMIHLESITPVPTASEFLQGTTNLRGQVLAVLDIRSFFGASRQTASASSALVLGESRIEFALIADQVEEVAAFRTIDFFDSTGAISSPGRDWVRGISKNSVILLNARVLLTDSRLFVDEA